MMIARRQTGFLHLGRQQFLKNLWVIWIISFFSLNVCAQTDEAAPCNKSFFQVIKNDGRQSLHLGYQILGYPFNTSKSDWLRLASVGALSAVLLFNDSEVRRIALANQNSTSDNLFKIEDYLNGRTGSFAAAGMYTAGLFFRKSSLRRTGLYAMEALFISQSFTGLLKYSFGRTRPYYADEHLEFKTFGGTRWEYRSMPSGHTTGAFAFATIMAKSVRNPIWKFFWYSGAVLVGSARIYHNVHWFSDTVLAGFIGYGVAHYVYHFSERQNSAHTYSFTPVITKNRIGLAIKF